MGDVSRPNGELSGAHALDFSVIKAFQYADPHNTQALHGTAIGLPPQKDPQSTTPSDRQIWQSHGSCLGQIHGSPRINRWSEPTPSVSLTKQVAVAVPGPSVWGVY